MKNISNHLAIEEFTTNETSKSLLDKLKDMFNFNEHFVNFYDEEEYMVYDEDDNLIYNSQLEEVFYQNSKEIMSLVEIKDLINKIGNTITDLYEDEYSDFNIVFIESEDKATIAISLLVYFI